MAARIGGLFVPVEYGQRGVLGRGATFSLGEGQQMRDIRLEMESGVAEPVEDMLQTLMQGEDAMTVDIDGFMGITDVTVLKAEGLAISPAHRQKGLDAALALLAA